MQTFFFVTAAALIDDSGLVLLQKRPMTGSMPGLWEFPGGKVEPGETPEAALARELSEEIEVQVEQAALVPLAFASAPLSDRHLVLLLYACWKWLGEPRPLIATELKWVAPADMHDLDMPPADVPLVDALINFQKSGAQPVR